MLGTVLFAFCLGAASPETATPSTSTFSATPPPASETSSVAAVQDTGQGSEVPRAVAPPPPAAPPEGSSSYPDQTEPQDHPVAGEASSDDQAEDASEAVGDDGSERYLTGHQRRHMGGYGGIRVKPGAVGRYFGLFVGGGGGLIAGKFHVGGAGYGMFRDFGDYRLASGARLELGLGYGGLVLGGEFASVKAFGFAFQGLIGAGGACLSHRESEFDEPACIDSSALFVVEPEFQVRVRVAKPLRIGLSLGYRFVVTEDWRGPEHFELAGPSGAISVDFGWF